MDPRPARDRHQLLQVPRQGGPSTKVLRGGRGSQAGTTANQKGYVTFVKCYKKKVILFLLGYHQMPKIDSTHSF